MRHVFFTAALLLSLGHQGAAHHVFAVFFDEARASLLADQCARIGENDLNSRIAAACNPPADWQARRAQYRRP